LITYIAVKTIFLIIYIAVKTVSVIKFITVKTIFLITYTAVKTVSLVILTAAKIITFVMLIAVKHTHASTQCGQIQWSQKWRIAYLSVSFRQGDAFYCICRLWKDMSTFNGSYCRDSQDLLDLAQQCGTLMPSKETTTV
jgi:hypothetical protein